MVFVSNLYHSQETGFSATDRLGQFLAVFTVEEVAYGLPASGVRLACRFTLVGVHAQLVFGRGCFRGAALGAAVGETGLIRLEFELFRADGADFDGEGHLQL